MTNPKLRHLTPEDEAAIEQAERMHARAHVVEIGVARYLGHESSFRSSLELEVAYEMLGESITLRKQAWARQNAIKSKDEANRVRRKNGKQGKGKAK